MSDNKQRTKPKYEAPTVIPLTELARGTGECRAGSGASEGDCTAGTLAASYCTAGTSPTTACTDGSLPHT
jgi:hypothetical protein